MPRIATKTVRIPAEIVLAVEAKYPDRLKHGTSWLIASVVAEACKLDAPRTPDAARSDGGKAGTGEVKARTRKQKVKKNKKGS